MWGKEIVHGKNVEMSRKQRVFPEQGRSVQDRRGVRVTALSSEWQRKGEMFTFFTEILFFS